MNRSVVVALACMLGVAGCTRPVMPPGMEEQQPHASDFARLDFACPPAGTIVEHWTGEPAHYLGSVEDDPVTCLLAGPSGNQRQLYLVFGDPTPRNAPPLAGAAEIRRAMASFWRRHDQRQPFTFSYLGTYSPDGTPFVTETWRVLGPMQVDLRRMNLDGPDKVEAVRVERVVRSIAASGAVTQTRSIYVLERQTRAVLRTGVQMYRGSNPTAVAPPSAIAFQAPR